jgi:hypothetical protein
VSPQPIYLIGQALEVAELQSGLQHSQLPRQAVQEETGEEDAFLCAPQHCHHELGQLPATKGGHLK